MILVKPDELCAAAHGHFARGIPDGEEGELHGEIAAALIRSYGWE